MAGFDNECCSNDYTTFGGGDCNIADYIAKNRKSDKLDELMAGWDAMNPIVPFQIWESHMKRDTLMWKYDNTGVVHDIKAFLNGNDKMSKLLQRIENKDGAFNGNEAKDSGYQFA